MSRATLAALSGVLVAAALAAGWPVAPADVGPGTESEVAPAVVPLPALPAAPGPALAGHSGPAPGATPCAGARAMLSGPDGAHPLCLGPARMSWSGDVRTWRAESIPAGAWIEVDLAGEDVLAARLQAAGVSGACEAEACSGIGLGARDGHGARVLHLHQAHLSAGAVRWQLDAALPLPAADTLGACSGEVLDVTGGDGSAWRFCASTTAVARLDDGRRWFHLRSPEGDVLRVGLDAEGALDEIEVDGRQCRQWQCSGAVLAPDSEPPGTRVLRLDGVALQDANGTPRATVHLRGRVALPDA